MCSHYIYKTLQLFGIGRDKEAGIKRTSLEECDTVTITHNGDQGTEDISKNINDGINDNCNNVVNNGNLQTNTSFQEVGDEKVHLLAILM